MMASGPEKITRVRRNDGGNGGGWPYSMYVRRIIYYPLHSDSGRPFDIILQAALVGRHPITVAHK